MALQKRLDYGFNGYQVPPTPRAARSVRRRCLFKKKPDDQQMCAFDLLATVAGKLLLDGETSSAKDPPPPHTVGDSVAKEEKDEENNNTNNNKPLKEKSCDQDCYERNFLFTELVSEAPTPNLCTNEAQNEVISRPASGITTSDCSAEQLVNDDCKLSLGIFPPSVDVESQVKMDSANNTSNNINNNNRNNLLISSSNNNNNNKACWDRKPSPLACSVDNVKFPFCGTSSFPVRDNVKLVNRDDDENSSECTEPSNRKDNKALKAAGPGPGAPQQRRFRKLLASSSKPCKITTSPNIVKDDGRCYNADTERCNYLNRKNGFKRQRSLRDYPFKKRKLYDCSSASNSDEGNSSGGICRVPENSNLTGGPSLPGVIPTPTPVAVGGNSSFNSRSDQVKLKIKSFRVPELFIEIPETATVASLKRTVMEAVTAVLGGGLRVGVVVQGKKIRDDSKTLLQSGISHDNNKMDALGFSLEPTTSPAPIRLYPEDSPQPLARYPPAPSFTQNGNHLDDNTPPDHHHHGTSFNNFIESDHDSAPSPPGISLQRTTSESKALVPVPSMKPDALAVVPLRKSKRSESAQRRIRRPFTVAEVEALVQAVEKLGTGRWRDVKLRAFDSAKHRTYVDLKDKWKTLVHTAKISPQQRRGEPVPQELLDRVLMAHAYWSQQQAKQQQLKSLPDTCLLL